MSTVWGGCVQVPRDQELPPIDEILECLSHDTKWSPKDSIFKLIIILCLPKMGLWDIIRTCVYRAEPKEVQDLICHYAEEGKPIELAALLCFAPVEFFCYSSDDDLCTELLTTYQEQKKNEWLTRIETLRKHIAAKIVSLIVEEQKLMGSRSSKLAQICKEKKRLMMSVMLLLEIYERIGDDLEYYVNGANGIVDLMQSQSILFTGTSEQAEKMAKLLVDKLKDSGFPVTNEFFEVFKHMNCSCDERQPKVSGGVCRYQFEQKHPNISMYTKIWSPPITKKETIRMPFEQQWRSISTHTSQEKPGLLSMVLPRSISTHTSQEKPFSIYTSERFPKFCTSAETQTRKTIFQVITRHVLDQHKTFEVIKRPMSGVVLSKKLSSFLSLSLKRVI